MWPPLRRLSRGCCVWWTPGDEQVAGQAALLRAALPGWGVWWDPFALVWVAVRGRHDPPVTASTPARLLHRITGTAGEDIMTETRELAGALNARGLIAVTSGRAVHTWHPGDQPGAILVCPGWSPGGAALWSWQQGTRAGHHARADFDGTADAVAAFLAGGPPPDPP